VRKADLWTRRVRRFCPALASRFVSGEEKTNITEMHGNKRMSKIAEQSRYLDENNEPGSVNEAKSNP
jgi:hypothetical protein